MIITHMGCYNGFGYPYGVEIIIFGPMAVLIIMVTMGLLLLLFGPMAVWIITITHYGVCILFTLTMPLGYQLLGKVVDMGLAFPFVFHQTLITL